MDNSIPSEAEGKEAAEAFLKRFKTAEKVQFNPRWMNRELDTPDFVTEGEHALKLAVGEIVGTLLPDDREMLIIGTEIGNFTVFRYVANNPNLIGWGASALLWAYVGENFDPGPVVTIDLLGFFIGKDEQADNIAHVFMKAAPEQRDWRIEQFRKENPTPTKEAPTQPQPEEIKMNASNKTNATTVKPQLSNWGVFWRVAGIAMLIIAVITAICFGLYFGAAWIAGLGYAAGVLTALKYFMVIVAGLGISESVIRGQKWIEQIFARKAPAAPKAAAAEAAPAAAPAAA